MEERRARARIQETQDTRSKTHEGKNPPSGAKAGVCRNAPVFPVKAATAPSTPTLHKRVYLTPWL